MKSILQEDESRCFICGGYECGDHLDTHHIFNGALRQKSERLGLVVKLHHNKCHQNSPRAVHKCAELMLVLKAYAQKVLMERYGWTEERFRQEFGKSYIGYLREDTPCLTNQS